MTRLTRLVSSLLLGGCAATAPTSKPLWVVPRLAVPSAPLIHDGIVYVQPQESGSPQTRLAAYDLHTGRFLWTAPFPTTRLHVAIGPRLVVTDSQGLLHSLDAKSGREIGTAERSGMLSATAAHNRVYAVFQDRTVAALDRPGHVLWQASVPMTTIFEPVVAGDTVYVYGLYPQKRACAIHAFEAETGKLRWKWETEECSGPEDQPLAPLVADGNAAYLRIDSPTVDAHAGLVLAFDAVNGRELWRIPTVTFHPSKPILFETATLVIAEQSGFRALDRATGRLLWESRTASKYPVWTADNGILYVANRKAHALIGTGNATSPDSFLTAVDLRTGRELWHGPTVQLGSFSVPAVAAGIVVVASLPFGDDHPEAGGLFAFAANREGRTK